ncbi:MULTISPECIES: cyclic peptide export ABC transporter [unclassified Sinorhizobium]|uniref:cyclic peptide export ABC transporter n=1 Tax=unclassified Sinorhizobium TaxID=2613772 RepID=UPI0035245B03
MRDQNSLISEGIRLLKPFWLIAVFATGMGTLSGLATAWLLATINHALYADGDITAALMWTFAGLVVLTLAGEIVSDLGNSWIGQQVIASLRKDLVARVVAAPIDQIERYKAHRLLSALGQDVDTVSAFSYGFSALAIALAVTIACIAYLLFLSPVLFVIVAIAIGAGITFNRLARRRGSAYYDEARSAQDDLYRHYRSITDGAKELRINRERRMHVHGIGLASTIDRIRDTKTKAFRIFMSANAADSALFFAAIGLIVGWQGWFGVERATVSGFVLVLLYVKGPLDQALNAYGSFVNAQVSFKRIAQLSADFANPEPHLAAASHVARPSSGCAQFQESIELRGALYRFPAAQGVESFTLGPIDLTVGKGEILFIVGENGSGKTTLIKLLLGLYQPLSGALYLDGSQVTAENRDDYRQLFSAIFFDYFLFDDVVAPEGEVAEQARAYLEQLEIGRKVRIENGRFSTTDLSAGQRKRLALVQVYLEGRPIIVFDEWAAEQDPTFRRIFYTEMLPDLKKQGKTLIVISHDDRYFSAADRIARIDQGKIVEDIAKRDHEPAARDHSRIFKPLPTDEVKRPAEGSHP